MLTRCGQGLAVNPVPAWRKGFWICGCMQVYTWSSWLLWSHCRIAGNFRMVTIFIYFVCSIPYTKIKTAKIWTYNFLFFRAWPLTYTPTTATRGHQRQVLNARLAHWTMSLYQFFAKASKRSDLSDASGPLSASIMIKEASDASITIYRTKCERYQLHMPVADLGFLEGGFYYTVARKILEATPIFEWTPPISIVLSETTSPIDLLSTTWIFSAANTC